MGLDFNTDNETTTFKGTDEEFTGTPWQGEGWEITLQGLTANDVQEITRKSTTRSGVNDIMFIREAFSRVVVDWKGFRNSKKEEMKCTEANKNIILNSGTEYANFIIMLAKKLNLPKVQKDDDIKDPITKN